TPGLGLGTIGLAALGAVRGARAPLGRRLAGLYASAGSAMALVSLGPRMRMGGAGRGVWGLHALLARVVPGLDALRVPSRAAVVAVLFFSVLAAFGADA